ncbi:MAG: hypothetical protein VYD90_12840 [Pseudomonadota bacterium]|nr:hypothetical protein [Pseudomonadota bacterium]
MLRGARAREKAAFRNLATSAWLTGLLSQSDPRSYPTLESLIGDDAKASEPQRTDPAEAKQNLRMWGVWLKAVNRKSAAKPPAPD